MFQNLLLVVLVVIALLLAAHLWVAIRNSSRATVNQLQGLIDQLAEDAARHIDITAVLALTEKVSDKPEILEKIGEYS